MTLVNKIVDKIIDHYTKLNQLKDLEIILKEHNKNNLKIVNKKEKSSLIFDCNHIYDNYHVFFQFINYNIDNCNLKIFYLNNNIIQESFIKNNKTSFKLNSNIKYFYVSVDDEFIYLVNNNQKNIFINERSIISNIICLVNYHYNITKNVLKNIKNINNGFSLIKNLYDSKKDYEVKTNYSISDIINLEPNGGISSSRNLFNFYVNCYFLYNTNENFKTFMNVLVPRVKKDFYHIFLHLYKLENNNYILLNNIIDEVKKYNNLPVKEYRVYKSNNYIENDLNTNIVNNFIISLRINNTGSINNLFGGPANFKIDKNNRIWITNNVVQGSGDSSNFIVILESDGTPAPFSPLFDKNLEGTGYGIEMSKPDSKGNQYVISSSYGWGSNISLSPFKGNIVKINVDTLERTYSNITNRVQGMKIDNNNNLWICSYGDYIPMGGSIPLNTATYLYEKNSSTYGKIFCVFNLDFNNYTSYTVDLKNIGPSFKYHPFDIDINNNNEVFVSCSGDYNNKFETKDIPGSVLKLKLRNNTIELLNYYMLLNVSNKNIYKGCCVNKKGDKLYVCDIQNDRVIEFNTNDLSINKYIEINKLNNNKDGKIVKINGPWGVSMNNDELIIANFGKNTYVSSGIPIFNPSIEYVNMLVIYNTKLEKYKGYICTNGGREIKLLTDQNFYNPWGIGNIKSFQPIQRSTFCGPDKNGNIILMNNWKPLILYDIKTASSDEIIEESNPGGDSIIIFLGITDF
jgi:hypothetical protein